MNHHYQVIEWVGISEEGIEEAIHDAILQAAKRHGPFDWYEVMQTHRKIEGCYRNKYYQAHVKIGCHAH